MKLLLSSLLLGSLCALSSWSVSSTGSPAVNQSPDVSVVEGEAVNITCCWTLDFQRIRVYWLKNQTEIKNEIFDLKNVSRGPLLKEASGCSHLNFAKVRREDSGRYICKLKVEIPTLVEDVGNGTVINVMAKDNTKDNTAEECSALQTPVIISLAVVAQLLLIALVCFCCLRRRRAQATRVIYEVPHIDSEEVEMDKHSTSSSKGSSQWCQVPVYESCDYFEHVETKESG